MTRKSVVPAPVTAPEPELKSCALCTLSETRTHIVSGEGSKTARLMFIGERPGEQEDFQGRPFLGPEGQLLEKMVEAIGLKRADVFLTNIVQCRPPEDRNPRPEEIQACLPALLQQIDQIKPQVIVALGKIAAQTLLGTEQRISELRGHFHSYRGARLMPTFHPGFLLRNPSSKKEAWADLQLVAAELGIKIPKEKL